MSPCPNEFLFAHLESRNPALSRLRNPEISLAELNALAEDQACPVRFCAEPTQGALDYERRIVHDKRVHTRIHTWHDRLNAAMWILWPQTKLGISKAHLEAAQLQTAPGTRNRRRDALTLLDEVGVVIVADPETEALHRSHAWTPLFWQQRERWFQSIIPLFIGHGLAEQCLSPYIGLTGKALYLHLCTQDLPQVDEKLAGHLADPERLCTPRELLPFPLLGTPGWHPDNDNPDFYRNQRYFRPRSNRLSSRN